VDRPAVRSADGRTLACEPVPNFLMDMVRAGGLLQQLRERLKDGRGVRGA
jgi:3-isopropylmalate/(R)-2-methylmalate dehydratase small subunit